MKSGYKHYYSNSNDHKASSEIRLKSPSLNKTIKNDYIVVVSSEYEKLYPRKRAQLSGRLFSISLQKKNNKLEVTPFRVFLCISLVRRSDRFKISEKKLFLKDTILGTACSEIYLKLFFLRVGHIGLPLCIADKTF